MRNNKLWLILSGLILIITISVDLPIPLQEARAEMSIDSSEINSEYEVIEETHLNESDDDQTVMASDEMDVEEGSDTTQYEFNNDTLIEKDSAETQASTSENESEIGFGRASQTIKEMFSNEAIRKMVVGALQISNPQVTENTVVSQEDLDLIKSVNFDTTMGDITSLSEIELLTNLEELAILGTAQNYFELSDLTPLSELTNLKVLSIQYSNITDLDPLSNLKNLESLNLNENQIVDTTPLKDLNNLKYLTLERNRTMTNFAGLTSLSSLESLYMFNTGVNDLSVLSGLQNLTYLDVERNKITNEGLEGLTNVPSLKTFRADDNQITSVEYFKNMPSLTSLELNFNQVSDLTPLNGLGISIKASSQEVTGEPVSISVIEGKVELPVKHSDDKVLSISSISNGGTFDSETNMLNFESGNLNELGGLITFKWSGSNFSGTYTMPYTVVIETGSLSLSVPEIINFNDYQKSKDDQIVSRNTVSGLGILVNDTRSSSNRGDWKLTAQVTNQSDDIGSYLIFVDQLGNKSSLSNSPALIYSQTTNSDSDESLELDVSSSWTNNTGILLDIPSDNDLAIQSYSATITWNLVEGP